MTVHLFGLAPKRRPSHSKCHFHTNLAEKYISRETPKTEHQHCKSRKSVIFAAIAAFEVDSRVVAVSILVTTTSLADIEPKILCNVVDVLKEVIKRGPSLGF